MKEYKVEQLKDKDIFTEKTSQIKEASMTVNTIQDAQEAIGKCVTYIMKKKAMNVGACMSLIGEGLTSGIDSIDEFLPQAAESNPSSFQAKKRVIASRVARMLLAYSKTK